MLSRDEINVVCVLHGGFPVPRWLDETHQIGTTFVTVNDPAEHDYADLSSSFEITRNLVSRGFAENVNAALTKIFGEHDRQFACIVNFDLALSSESLVSLVAALDAQPTLAALGASLRHDSGQPTFTVGTWPTPAKEFFRAVGLRSGAMFRFQRWLLRRTPGWSKRNEIPPSGSRILGPHEYLPWTCLAVRRHAWERVGPLDERFPLYAEDIDWSLRCQRSGWGLGVHDSGPVTHFERATRGVFADTLYEYSHLELHRKWGWDANLRWQRLGLRARRCWPVRRMTAPLDWHRLTNLNVGARP